MTGSVASASSSSPQRIFIVAPNWLGDGIMAMPAVQALRNRLPEGSTIEIAVKPGQHYLWEMHPDINEVSVLPENRLVKKASINIWENENFTTALILPNSFRSAWFPYRLHIPHRRGTTFQLGRKWLINDAVNLEDLSDHHQQWEMARILLGEPLPETLPAPRLQAPATALESCTSHLRSVPDPILGLIPGAARGPSKQWAGERFQSVAKNWIRTTGGSVCWMGTPDDRELCSTLNAPLKEKGTVLAGRTSLQEFAAAITLCDVVVANDSGGMHLAAALGTPVVAIFGITDPEKTGPLSPQAIVVQQSTIRNRRIPRESPEARAALDAVTPQEVTEAVLAFHDGPDKGN